MLLPANCLSVLVHFVVLVFIVFNTKWIKWHKILRSLLKTPTHQLPLGWNTYLLFNFDIVNFVWKADEGKAESIVLLFLFFGGSLIFGGWEVVGWGREFYLVLKSYLFPAGIYAKAICMTYSGMLYRLDISTFIFLFQIFSLGNL